MALRINTNIGSLYALRNLEIADFAQNNAIRHISSGLRVQRASDGPADMVKINALSSDIASVQQAVTNTTFASNLLSLADSALSEIGSILTSIRSNIVAANNQTDVSSYQTEIDAQLGALDRIVASTRFSGIDLFNGRSSYQVTSRSALINDLRLYGAEIGALSSSTFTVAISAVGSQAVLDFTGSTVSNVTFTVTGPSGTQSLTINDATANYTATAIASAIALNRTSLGTWGSNTALYSEEYGSSKYITLSVTSKSSGSTLVVNGSTLATGGSSTDYGSNTSATVNGAPTSSTGLRVRVGQRNLNAEILLDPTVTTSDAPTFTVAASGLTFQIGSNAVGGDRLRVGIPNLDTTQLGMASETVGSQTFGGYLNSLESGQTNALQASSTNTNPLRIVDEASSQVSTLRAYLGGIDRYALSPQINILESTVTNLKGARSEIQDIDFASEVAELTRAQILFSAGTAVLGSSNSSPFSLLSLLQQNSR